MATTPKGFFGAFLGVVEPPLDPTLVDHTSKLLHLLNTFVPVQKLLNRREARGFTLIHLAAERNQPESLKCLLIKDGNPNVKSYTESSEVTPVHVAAGAGHLACLQLLVQLGGDVLARDTKQLTPIDYANINGQELCLNYLHSILSKKHSDEQSELEDVLVEVERNLAANNLTTLAHWKLFNSFFPLAIPSDPNSKELNQTESIVYRHCLLINNQELVRVLSRVAKDIPLTHSHCSLLHAAARYGRCELVRLITEKVPQLALTVTAEGYNALHIAVAHRQLAIVKLLTQKQSQWSHHKLPPPEENTEGMEGVAKFGSSTMSGHTVLHFAVAVKDQESLRYMLKHHRELQLSVNASECGYSPLHLAVLLNNRDAVHMLLKRGANPNTRLVSTLLDKLQMSRTPLTEAVCNRNPEILNLLLDGGADDRHHDALRVCVPTATSQELLLPLLGSLVRADESHRPMKAGYKGERRIKMAAVEWSNLSLPDLSSSDFTGAVSKSLFLRSQPGLDKLRYNIMDYVTCVNLSNNSLSALPVELFQLSRLTTLNLANNRLVALPEIYKQNIGSEIDPYIYPCALLSKLNVSKNLLAELPEFLFDLPNLSNLDLSHNHLRHLPLKLWTAPKLHTLNVSNNSIEEIPTNWPQVLQECTVINTTPPPDQQSPQCTSPTSMKASPLVRTPRDDVPRYLSLSTESRTSTEDDRGSDHEATPITKLQDRLNIANANLPIEWEKISASEEEYEGMAILNFSNNRISEIPENLPCLAPKLKRLDLSNNEISNISMPRSFPSTLTNLYLSHNRLNEVDCQQALAKPLPCTNPQVLIECNNTIHLDNISYCAHRSHGQLISLGVLEISNCQLEVASFYTPQVVNPTVPQTGDNENSIPDPRLAAAQTQRRGRRASNPQNLRRLVTPLLTRLTLHHNQLNDVPESVCEITSLTSLDLSYNNIIQLPANLGNLGNLWEFPLGGLKLISPPHNIIERGKTKDIIGFLWSLLQKARPYHRMKLMLVGKAARGKTTLLMKISERGQRGIQENWGTKRMRDVPPNVNLSTVGIVVSDWTYYRKVKVSQTSLKSITFMTWDFGGQEEYYATHQCFLSRRSLYLVVWNVTHYMEGAEELKPWLLNIQARAPHSPVLIVGTHYDKVRSRSQRQMVNQCVEFIDTRYGTPGQRREGYPQIFGNFLVSCTSGKGIGELRDSIFDVASQVKENTVTGRGIGCGRIPEYRLLMDQLVPASYLQLEDTVKKIAFSMRQLGKPPVLTYKELRDHVFQDPHTLISKSSVDRELEQAVRFLHDNGTMLHYDDPLLCDLYFVDPQWLCDMLAHIITVREINPMIRDGIMKIRDLRHVFNDQEFPIRWQREYIRLLTTFEVAVELSGGELLIPSTLPMSRPNLPQSMFPDEVKLLPPLRHVYIVPFIPSGFWPRLISRLLTDPSITSLARTGCDIPENEVDQLSWVKWRTGMILQYGNLKLLAVSELEEGLFPEQDSLEGIRIFSDDRWRLHKADVEIFGINIEVPDVYPILKYPEVRSRSKYVRVRPWLRKPPPDVTIQSSGSHDLSKGSEVSENVRADGANREIHIDQLDDEIQRLVEERRRRGSIRAGLVPDQEVTQSQSRNSEDILSAPTESTPLKPLGPIITEDTHDMMRVGLLSKVVEHITLLVEDWFVGVRPRTLVVPCPHCTANCPYEPIRVQRSFSNIIELLPDNERREREWMIPESARKPPQSHGLDEQVHDDSLPTSPGHPYRLGLNTDTHSHINRHSGGQRPLSVDRYAYAFRYHDCVVTARSLDTMFCPAHGDIQLQYMAPDTLFLTQGKDVIVKDITGMEKIGQGAFATVFKAKYRKSGAEGEVAREVAVKALTKEWKQQEQEGLDPEAREMVNRAPTRHSIVEGFNNLKKELSILSPLKHTHVIGLFGVMLRPLGLVLELAPQGSMKDKLKAYAESECHAHVAVLQPLIIQLSSAIQYLHSCSIIYRDLKSDNVLVWRFPDPLDAIPKPPPGQQLGEETVFVKLSDYGISQFVATQGARGLVGTPGFIAPEILKYQGREVYTHQVDIFSFGMLLYECITLHIPYENLNAQQANQANERGSRPPLTKKDLPCPVLLRELMVWCWQQNPEHRPTADEIIHATGSEQFPRLLDGIRACNSGQVTSSCVRVTTPTLYRYNSKMPRTRSPSNFSSGSRNSQAQSPSQPLSLIHRVTSTENGAFLQTTTEPSHLPLERGDSESSSPSGQSPFILSPRRASLDEPRSKYLWSPRISELFSPISDEEQLTYELWVCSSDAHHSTAAVIEYSGRFTNVEDIELGDSVVLSMCAARDKVWMGFEIGYLIIFDANSKKPSVQLWVKHHKAILSMVYIPALRKVYVGLSDGTVYAYGDDVGTLLPQGGLTPSKLRLTPLAEYSDPSQSSSSFLVIPQGKKSDNTLSYELWVGQKRGVITILDAETLNVIKFVRTTMDMSKVPSYTAYLSYAHLVCGMSPDYSGECVVKGCVTAYGALYHGQFVSRWDTIKKKEENCISCEPFMEDQSQDCCISSLLYSHSQLYVGLTCGVILIFEPYMQHCLGRLTCHRSTVQFLLTLDLSLTAVDDITGISSLRSGSPLYPSSDSDTQSLGRRSPTLSSLGVSSGLDAISRHLISIGSGFKSYFDGPESEITGHSGFLLVWDSEHWKEGSTG